MNLRMRVVVILVLLAGSGVYMSQHRDMEVPLARAFSEFPPIHNGWKMVGQSNLSEEVIKVLLPTDYLSRRYVREDGATVDMYLSFFNGSPEAGRIHSPKNCLPGGGWTELSSRRRVLELGKEKVNLVQAVYAQGESREVIYYWYAMRGQTLSDEFSLKLAEIKGSMFHGRRDQSFMRISTYSKDDLEVVTKRIEDFLRDFYPVIIEYLPS